jgi:hypothetical protein
MRVDSVTICPELMGIPGKDSGVMELTIGEQKEERMPSEL